MRETPTSRVTAYRGGILHFLHDPGTEESTGSWQYFEDGLLLVEDGRVAGVGSAETLLATLGLGVRVVDHSAHLLVPGFVDIHVHYPQIDVIAAPGRTLLHWLEHYTFPEEARFGDAGHARATAEFFLDELMRNGTTTAQVFGTVHKVSVDAFFQAAADRGLRMTAGKAMMDRHCPESLRDTPATAYADSARLIEDWHGRDRLQYAITPRFAITSSPEQLAMAGRLAREHPGVRVHSHVAENRAEVEWIGRLYPECRSYLDVYDSHGLLGPATVLAHCIHLDDDDRRRMKETGASAAFCPTSNLFLGSGMFDIAAADRAGMQFAIASDVGGGTSLNMLRTLSEAYKVSQLAGAHLPPLRALYLATLGGARAMGLDRYIGNFAVGKEADFVALDPAATPLGGRRDRAARTLQERIFALIMLGDDRTVAQTYVRGRPMPVPAN